MKKALISLALCCFLVVGNSFVAKSFAAQTDTPSVSEHAAHAKQDASKPQVPDDTSKNLQLMQEHIDKMHAQMEKIKATTNPQERQKLLEEYMTTMMDGMKMLKSLPGCKMMSEKKGMMGMMSNGEKMSEGKMSEGKMGDKKSMTEGKCMMGMMSGGKGMMGMEDMMKCHKMMEKKNEMMQGMFEGLITSTQMMLQMKK
ncbi:MAG: hypothetical protein HQK70_04465 [Desulfamplus sp.]|nr:hypothetical protein [Desulfamplus sp.]